MVKSLLRKIEKTLIGGTIRPGWFPKRPKSADAGVLLSVEYDGDESLAKLKIYDLERSEVYEWLDNSGHLPYCITDYEYERLANAKEVTGHPGYMRLEKITKKNLLLNKDQELTAIVANNPLAIGGRTDSMREIIGQSHSWEDNIPYAHCYVMDRALVPGLYYSVKENFLTAEPQDIFMKDAEKLMGLFEEGTEVHKMMAEFVPLFLTKTGDIPRLAMDIEVAAESEDKLPDVHKTPQPIIAISFVDDSGENTVLVLDDGKKILDMGELGDANIITFTDEKELIDRALHVLWRTPILLTYNGDGFDLIYLHNRARKLTFPADEIPITISRSHKKISEARLKYGIHIDLYRFFYNRSIKGYAFSNKYEDVALNTVAKALIHEGKVELDKFITDLNLHELAVYCLQDSVLTMKLSQFDNDLVMNLILLLMRVSHQGMDDVTRNPVSNWIRSLFFFMHRHYNYLIPKPEEILKAKGEAVTKSTIEGKKFKGAIVVDPKSGIHFGVTVLDFASLYPSIMKSYNVSFETMRCEHEECKQDIIPDTTHWICKKRRGITSMIIEVIRDVRVKYFKPRAKDDELPEEVKSWFSVIEQALKVYLNASYGVLAASHFPLYCPPAAESVTAIGRHSIESTIEKAESLGIDVLYGDTDSLFLDHAGNDALEELMKFSRKELKVELDVEKVYRYVAMSERKKNYIGITTDDKIDIKGLTGKKRHTPPFIQEAFNEMTEILKQVQTEEDFDGAREEILTLVKKRLRRLEDRDFSVRELEVRMQITRELDTYKKTTPQHVKAGRQLVAAGHEIGAGQIISFVKTTTAGGVKPTEFAKVEDIAVGKYRDLIESTFGQVFDAIGLEWPTGIRSLDEWGEKREK